MNLVTLDPQHTRDVWRSEWKVWCLVWMAETNGWFSRLQAGRGVDPYGTGGTRPTPNIWTGGHDHECPPPIFLE